MTIPALIIFVSLLAPSSLCIAPAVAQEAAAATISGSIVARESGLPIGNATVALYQGTKVLATTTTDNGGNYQFPNEPAGAYSVLVTAAGYQPTRVADIFAAAGATATIRTALIRAETSSTGGLREIGQTTARATGQTLASTSTIQTDISPSQLESQGFLKAADALQQVPGVNLSGSAHSVGDDTFIDIRGMGTGETRPLIDGHGVGPLGVGGNDTYDYANSSYFLMRNIEVTEGSGATGLYGTDVIGGTIDFQTLDPTAAPHAEVSQAYGNLGTLISQFKTTGSFGRLGYALGHTVSGTYGDFKPGQIFQGARPNNNGNANNGGACTAGNDVTTCNQLLNTYSVSGNFRLQNDLGKLRYSFNDSTALTLTAYAANQLSDSTGNGDNDNIPYDTRLAELSIPANYTCAGGYLVITNKNPNACYTPAQYAATSSGPYGGGADRNRGTTLQDYHARFTTLLPANNALTIDYFRDFYDFRKNSNQASGLDATGTYYVGGGTFEDRYLTNGLLVSDEIAGQKNDLGLGYYVEHQREYGDNLSITSTGPVYVPQQEYGSGDFSFFVRDQFTATPRFSIFTNAWLRRDIVTEKTTFDPRVSLVGRVTNNDIVRLTGGRADGDPAGPVKAIGGINGIGNPSSLNPSCTLLNSVASGGNPSVQPESANDLEAAYGHRFHADTTFNVVGYVSSEKNRLFSAIEPITQFGPLAIDNPGLAPLFGQYARKINSSCPGADYNATTVLSALGISTTYNAASGLYRGFEFSGRVRLDPKYYVDYAYNVQSSTLTGVPNTILAANPFIINNAQIYEIPVHTGSLTFDYDDHHGIETQLQGNYIGDNNQLNRPAYTYFNGFVSKTIGSRLRATLSSTNLFDQNVQLYGYFGHQLLAPVNSFAPQASSSIGQAVAIGNATALEEIGLSPRQVILSLSAQI
jgi:outer membrane receptor protein involved in Fe transport